MSTISETFKKRKALITYITAGDPSLAKTEALIYALEKAGADIIEIGVPFSDPLADGPVIQASHARALKNDTCLNDVFTLVKKVSKKSDIRLVLMLSDNLIVQYGMKKFYKDAEKAGVDGIIVPDLPFEEQLEHRGKTDQIFLVAPTSTDNRIKMIAQASTGFIYLIAIKGITGQRKSLSEGLPDLVGRVRQYTDKPIALGFGISTPEQVKEAAQYVDGVIVGSALVERIAKNQPLSKITAYIKSLRKALDV